MPPLIGRTVGSYRILSLLGAGGMGEVYLADDLRLGRRVALKVVAASKEHNPEALARFRREARAVAVLSHPNIVAIHHLGEDEGLVYAVIELLEGETLRERLQRGPLPWKEAVRIATSVATGLAAAHERGIIHRDIKPENIFLTAGDGVKVLDFGLARMADPPQEEATEFRTAAGMVAGTPGYMAPEQLAGGVVDERSDLFALGCTIYEMLAGRNPFGATSVERYRNLFSDQAEELTLPGVPPTLASLLQRLLRREPGERPATASEVVGELQSLRAPSSISDAPTVPFQSPARRKVPLWLTAAVLLCVGAVILFVLTASPFSVSRPEKERISAIVVLPFENEAGDPQVDYISDGITEGLINALSRIADLRVIARTSAYSYKGRSVEPRQLRRELNVDAVVSGRVFSHDGTLVVQAELVDLRSNAQLWGDRIRRSVGEVLSLEEEIVRHIAHQLSPALGVGGPLRATATSSEEAYRLYLLGRHHWNQRTEADRKKAADYFAQALELDPNFALALVGLADTYVLRGNEYERGGDEEGRRLAEVYARQAIARDESLGEAYATMGLIASYRLRVRESEEWFRQATQLSPNYATAWHWYSLLLQFTGDAEAALAAIRRAETLDPRSSVIQANVANRLTALGRYDEALVSARRALELTPDSGFGLTALARAYEASADHQNAETAYRTLHDRYSADWTAANLASILANSGREKEARRTLAELHADFPHGRASAGAIARLHAALGENDRAFHWLEKAMSSPVERLTLMTNLRSVAFRSLHDDPRFEQLIRRVIDQS
jgi:eukaryotic-like serine/threonine-protein kinase